MSHQVCRRCVLNSRVPNVTFNAQGVCNLCQDHAEHPEAAAPLDPAEGRRAFLKHFPNRPLTPSLSPQKAGGEGDYDCLCLFSGGKDSTAMLYHLKARLGLKVLAFTLDNWMLSPEAHRNIERVTRRLGVDHMYYKPDWDLAAHLFRHGVMHADRTPRGRSLAFLVGHVCWPCFVMVSLFSIKTAMAKDIRRIVVGATPGQLRQKDDRLKARYAGVADIYFSMMRPLLRRLKGTYRARARLSWPEKLRSLRVRIVPFYEYFHYDEAEAFRVAEEECGWVRPADTDSCSTNCLTNALGIAIHKARYGISPYLIPLAYDVRTGLVTREDALASVSVPLDSDQVRRMAEKLDVPPDAYIAGLPVAPAPAVAVSPLSP